MLLFVVAVTPVVVDIDDAVVVVVVDDVITVVRCHCVFVVFASLLQYCCVCCYA